MTDINTTSWKPFIKLTLKGDTKGFMVLDVNRPITMVRDEDSEVTAIVMGDNLFTVAETPDEICTMVDAKIEEQDAKRRAEFEKALEESKNVEDTGNI